MNNGFSFLYTSTIINTVHSSKLYFLVAKHFQWGSFKEHVNFSLNIVVLNNLYLGMAFLSFLVIPL